MEDGTKRPRPKSENEQKDKFANLNEDFRVRQTNQNEKVEKK